MSEFVIDIDSLNPAQREAVLTTEGPLLVLAGAGSGKTRVLTYRIAHMIADKNIAPWRILAITFTNKAAKEMRERLSQLLPESMRGMWVCTFHSMCVRILREHATLLGYTSNFTIYDDDDSRRLVRDIMRDKNIAEKQFPINMIRGRISSAKNAMQYPSDVRAAAVAPHDRIVAEVYEELERRLKSSNAMDFDDLLVRTLELFKNHTDVLEQYQDRFRYISIDEYQDTNHVQYELAQLLASKYGNLMVVGDDDQSIYSWRGADISNILNFEHDFENAKVVKLEQNYRSTGHILGAANAVVRQNSQRKDKRLFTDAGDGELIEAYQASDERDEGRWIAGEIEKLHVMGWSYDDCAVFYRTNAQSRVLEDMFLRAGIPYKMAGGTRFFDRQEIRDTMAYLKMVVNPSDDVAVKRVINTPRRGIGTTSIQKIEALAVAYHVTFFQACELACAEEGLLSAKCRLSLGKFCALVRNNRNKDGELLEVVESIINDSGLIQALEAEHTPESQSRVENIQEFMGVVGEFDESHQDVENTLESLSELRAAGMMVTDALGDAGEEGLDAHRSSTLIQDSLDPIEKLYGPLQCKALPALMEWLALRSDLDSLVGETSSITMMTIHSAKGLEYPAVFVAGMEEGIFPHGSLSGDKSEAEIEEERRLAYVAFTRARKRLHLTYASIRHMFGQVHANPRSRFISEIPSEHIKFAGIGSEGFSGTGWEKRGDRHGTFGSGRGSSMYGGNVFGSDTRSNGRTQRTFGGTSSTVKRPPSTFKGKTPDYAQAASRTVEPMKRDMKAAAEEFVVGEKISHKTFGVGEIVAVDGDMLQVQFQKSGQTKKLMKGFAPITKIVE